MKTFITVFLWAVIGLTANAKPHCQGFNNYNGKVTIVLRIIKLETDTRFLMWNSFHHGMEKNIRRHQLK